MLKAALFSDGTREYRIPEEPECGENVKIRFPDRGRGRGTCIRGDP